MSHEEWAPERATIESSVQETVDLPPREGAPQERGPRGLVARMRSVLAKPEVQVWGKPLFRGVGMMTVLGCVAFLGKQSEEETLYGARVEVPEVGSSLPAEVAPSVHEGHTISAHPERADPPPCVEKKGEEGKSNGVLPDGRIIMNEATKNDFTQLPGVGESRAEKIIELRERMGKFKRVSDLLRVRGIGWKTLQKMKEMLVVDRPVEEPAEPKPASPQANAKESVGSGDSPS